MLPEITTRLLTDYAILLAFLVPVTFLTIRYHISIQGKPSAQVISPIEDVVLEKEDAETDIEELYKSLKKKYDPAKAADKKTRSRNIQVSQKLEKAYKAKDITALLSI